MKTDFDIVSYCSWNYRDAYNFVIKSWLENSNCNKITIYTDTDMFKSNNEKVKIIKLFDRSDDWLDGTGRRIDAVKHFSLNNPDCKRFVFLDIDCYVVRPFTEIFDIMENFYDVAVCRLNGRNHVAKETANAGVWMLKNNDNGKKFLDDWKQLAKIYRQKGKGVIPHKVSFAQYSFTDVAVNGFDGIKSYKSLIISEKKYNSECDDNTDKWIQELRKYNPSIVHFKKRKWREPLVVKKVFDVMKK